MNTMKVITVGQQVWAKKDLKVFKFRNGDYIPIVQNTIEWRQAAQLELAAMCINPDTGHCLYNWYAVNDPRGLAPKGWKVPTDADFKELLKSVKSDPKFVPKLFRTVKGMRNGYDGSYLFREKIGGWWCFAPDDTTYAWYRNLYCDDDTVFQNCTDTRDGLSVRCLLDI